MGDFRAENGSLGDVARHIAAGDYGRAAQIAQRLGLSSTSRDPDVLNVLALLSAHQKHLEEAISLLRRSLDIRPRQAHAQLNLGKLHMMLGRSDDAIAAMRASIKANPEFLDAYFELARALQAIGRLDQAETTCRNLLRLKPDNGAAKGILSDILIAQGKLDQAETALRRALNDPLDAPQKAQLQVAICKLLSQQGRKDEALAELDRASQLGPSQIFDQIRAELLHDLKRYDEALDLYRTMLAREPLNVRVHNEYNDLLYRLGRDEEYLKSFDRAPPVPSLQFAKASFLMHGKRDAEAYDVFKAMLGRNAEDKHASVGLATSLSRMGRHSEAVEMFDILVQRYRDDANLQANAASAFISYGDPRRALALCEQGSRVAPDNQICLALMGTAYRLLDDERDEYLNGYDSLIRIFELEPPTGFSDMDQFNAELNNYLDRLHPDTREHIAQSLRGGSQTIEEVFGVGHALIDLLEKSISAAVGRYICELPQDEFHPFLSRRRPGFSYAGSWSSRLADKGFHANHMHPQGWISSCYYVAVPDVVADPQTRQGWIKFGEPDLLVRLANPIRRAIQPIPGRLVLFPSYMWHGTIPFSSNSTRTTIAFDAVPRG